VVPIMIPIINFARQTDSPIEFSDPLLGDIHARCMQHAPDLVFAHDVIHRWSALIIPEVVASFVAEHRTSVTESAVESGVVDVLRQGHLTVESDQPATAVVRVAQDMDAAVVVIVDSSSNPVGLFLPLVVAHLLPQTSMVLNESSRFVRDVVNRATDDLVAAIEAIEGEHASFHSERLNFGVSVAYICKGGNAPHHVAFCPHGPHPSGPCGPRSVARI
jgi:hypothetical protein